MRNFSLKIYSIFILSLQIVGGCNDDNLLPEEKPFYTGEGIKIGANIQEALSSRSYIAEGPVTSGTFTLYYPYNISWIDGTSAYGKFQFLYNYGEVKFGFAGEETTGFVNVGTPTNPRELIWSKTNTGSSADDGIIYYPNRTTPSPVFLDNMPFKRRTEANTPNTDQLRDSIMSLDILPEGSNPFKAGVFDFENGSNDLLWGKGEALSGADIINIPMSHRMTRFVLNVKVDNTANTGMNIDLNNAIVWIEGLLLDPLSYLRKYGELRFERKISVNPPALSNEIDPELYNTRIYLIGGPNDELEDKAGDGIKELHDDWQWETHPDGIQVEEQLYTTQNFVFVPQDLRQGSLTRPRLVIAVPADDVNSGINGEYKQNYIYYRGGLPYTMNVKNEDGSYSMMTLNFMKGQVLTLTTQMRPGAPELEFAPVTVEPWVWKGTFSPNAKQSGIFNGEDFLAMVAAYEANDEFWLHKYGYVTKNTDGTETWNFQFNQGNVKIPAIDVVGRMKPGAEAVNGGTGTTPQYKFDFRNRYQYYVMPNGEEKMMGRTSETILNQIVQANVNSGVKTPQEFSSLISSYQENDWQMFIYGDYSLYDEAETSNHDEPGKWTFKIADNITLDANLITAQMIPPVASDPNFQFQIEGTGTVTVSNYPTEESTKSVDAGELYEIVSNRLPGLYSSSEFESLVIAINTNADEILEKYGTKSGEKWIFPLQRTFTLYTAKLQGTITNNSIDFEFNLNNHKIDLMQYDGTSVNPTADQLHTLLTLKKVSGINTPSDFTTLINTYNTNNSLSQLSVFGYYNLSGPKWNFVFNESMTLKMEDIQGKMKPESPNKLEFSFDLSRKIIYIEEEDSENLIELFGEQGATKLYHIVTGTEEEDPAEPGD